jgi:hypothetical protein
MKREVLPVQTLTMGDRVRLVESYEGVRNGSEGRVFGYYRRIAGELIAVSFDNGPTVPVPKEKLRTTSERTRNAYR